MEHKRHKRRVASSMNDRDTIIEELYGKGNSLRAIGAELGISGERVRQRLALMGTPKREPKMPTPEMIAARRADRLKIREAKLMAHLTHNTGPVDTEGHMIWVGKWEQPDKRKYGHRVSLRGRMMYVHQVILELTGRKPKGLNWTNICDTELCVNPDHWV